MHPQQSFDESQTRTRNASPRDYFETLRAPGRELTENEKAICRAEITRRYAWDIEQRPKRARKPPLMLLRLSELERLFQRRYGGELPNDDAGWGDLIIAAHTIAGMNGEVIKHIVAWACLWAPWLPDHRAQQLAAHIAANPRKFKADTLGWRLRLSMADRTALRITTIGAFDMNREQRAVERRKKDSVRARARRAARSTGKPRGRPTKNASAAGRKKKLIDSGADAFFATPTAGGSPATVKRATSEGSAPSGRTGAVSKGRTKARVKCPPQGPMVHHPAHAPHRWAHLVRRDGIGRVPIDPRWAQPMRAIAAAVAAGKVPAGVRCSPSLRAVA